MAVPPPLPQADKPALRSSLRAARRGFVAALSPDRLAACEAAIRDRVRPVLGRAGPLAGYVATGGEPDILPLLEDAARRGSQTALPHVAADRTMTFVSAGSPRARRPLGSTQPAAAGAVLPAVLLVPLVGFDRRGARLGQGGGSYDRWFAAHPDAWRIGIAWSVQEVATLPVDAWDVPLHGIVTELEWIET